MIKDRIAITKPTRVVIGVDRDDLTVKRSSIVDELVAEFWVDQGTDFDLPPFVEHGVRNYGWKVTRQEAAHIVPEVDDGIGGPNWRDAAGRMAEMLREGNIQEALDLHEITALQQAMVDEPEAHPHDFSSEDGSEPTPDTVCTFPGCHLRYEDRP